MLYFSIIFIMGYGSCVSTVADLCVLDVMWHDHINSKSVHNKVILPPG